MFQIIKNEYQYYIRTRWLLGISVGFVLVLVVSVLLGNYQTRIQTENYKNAQNHLRKKWESIKAMNPHGAAHYGTYIFKPANLIGSLDEGVNGITGNVLRVEGHVQNEIIYSEASQMNSVSKFGKLKSSLLLQYIVPILLIFLAFNSISSEKQSGRLKLLILQGAGPKRIIFAKAFSVWLYGIGLLALTMIVYAVFNFQHIDSEIVKRVFFFFVAYAFYYFIVSGIAVFFSSYGKNPTLALTSMLGIWIIWTIFLPNVLMSSVEKWKPLPSRNQMQTAMKEDRSKGIDGHNPSDEREKELEKQVLKKYKVDSLSQLPINFDGLVMQADEDYGNKVWDKHFGNLKAIFLAQKQTYQLGGVINPFISLQNASMGLAGNDNLHHQEFLTQVENYRRVFIKTLNDKHAYGGSRTGNWDWKADNDFFKSVPDFQYKPTSLSSVFIHYRLDFLVLASWTILVVILLNLGASKVHVQ